MDAGNSAAVAGQQRADRLPFGHRVPGCQGALHRFKTAPEPVPVIYGDHRPVNHYAHEADGACLRRGDRNAVVRGSQVHATVPAHPRLVRGIKCPQHPGPGREGPLPGRVGRGRRNRCGNDGRPVPRERSRPGGRHLPRWVEGRRKQQDRCKQRWSFHLPSIPPPSRPRGGGIPAMWKTARRDLQAVRRNGVPVVHLTEQFAVPSTSFVSAVKSACPPGVSTSHSEVRGSSG